MDGSGQRVLDRHDGAVRLARDDRLEQLIEGRLRLELDRVAEAAKRSRVAESPQLALDRHLEPAAVSVHPRLAFSMKAEKPAPVASGSGLSQPIGRLEPPIRSLDPLPWSG